WAAGAGRWVVATMLGLALVHGMGDAAPDIVILVPFGLSSGAVVGALQWLVLRGHIAPVPWVEANIASWSGGLTLGLAIARATGVMALGGPSGWARQHALVGAVVGVVVGTVT